MAAYTIKIEYRYFGKPGTATRKLTAANPLAARTAALKAFIGSRSDRYLVTGSTIINTEEI